MTGRDRAKVLAIGRELKCSAEGQLFIYRTLYSMVPFPELAARIEHLAKLAQEDDRLAEQEPIASRLKELSIPDDSLSDGCAYFAFADRLEDRDANVFFEALCFNYVKAKLLENSIINCANCKHKFRCLFQSEIEVPLLCEQVKCTVSEEAQY